MDAAGHLLEASQVLGQIDRKVDAVRADLVALAEELTHVEQICLASPAGLPIGASGELAVAMTLAQEVADRTRAGLGHAAPAPGPASVDADIMEHLREANQQLVLAVLDSKLREDAAEQAYHRQVDFIAIVAHELRNPLLPLRLATRLITEAQSDPAMLANLQATISGQVSHLARLIGDLLDGARLSTGKFRLERSVLDLTPVLRLAVETCMPAFQARNHRFSASFPPQPLMVDGDPVRLVQAFANLLENAGKYTPEGGTLRLDAHVEASVAVVTVSDNGIGIEPAALQRVFDLFHQDVRGEKLDTSGLGIGLAVVRELVEAHGGSVRATSPGKDQGSNFIVTLPLVSATPGHP